MQTFRRVVEQSGQVLLRILGKRHTASLVMASTLVLAGGATVYLAQPSSPAGALHGASQGTLPTSNRACEDQGYAWTAYTPTTGYYYCPQNAPQP